MTDLLQNGAIFVLVLWLIRLSLQVAGLETEIAVLTRKLKGPWPND